MRSAHPPPPDGAPAGVQGTLDDLGTPLAGLTFVVVDLETTGGSPADAAITEIGAVKVRGGAVLGEFATLVDPGGPIPPFITALTGITEQMVYAAPRIEAVLPAFLEFARGCVLVAHNAPFDIGFLKAACAAHGHPWPAFPVVDTVDLARRVLGKDEVPNCKLQTLARFFRAEVQPNHRALADARATVDVLHGLIGRLGAFGVTSFEELRGFAKAPTPEQRRKRHLADGLPGAPGVYLFEDAAGEVLYVGKSGDLRARVRSYFTGSETRGRVREMVGIAERVRPIVCATGLEAEVRELRLIAAHKPRYNRRSKFPERASWLKLTDEAFPRLSVVTACQDDGAVYLGPLSSRRQAEEARAALHEAVPLRQCTQRLTLKLIEAGKAAGCALAELGRCGAPCEGRQTPEEYAVHAGTARAIIEGDVRPVVAAAQVRIDRLAAELRYEEAAAQRDRLAAFVRAAARGQRLAALARCAQLVAARPAFDGGWELAVVRHGRLAAAGTLPPRAAPRPYVDALIATAETVLPGRTDAAGGIPAGAVGAGAGAEEMECVLRWLAAPGVRLVELDGDWTCPAHGAEGLRRWLDNAYAPVEPEGRRSGRPLR
ncbi:DEDD exonuclease domain-containing protein [Actinomadura macrotermitis]|uniref:Putative bifunctional exonuclease/endonuclease protein n=1 Tax=Actinomadura macrotermitis TaxID=2585200 RepID=A0A7K0BNP9_9ACTN|nr:DEDD exonuclease domain-containing protein [Actinomadura macrotermitis]MQY02492.1 putative bifunctional exonuclease/endonuclease protein [Actinomadura macrotermitis]